MLNDALDNGVPESEIREVILTSYLFDGYPTALEGFRVLHGICSVNEMIKAPVEYLSENIDLWRHRGEQLCRKVYGEQFEPLLNRISDFAPELKDSMIIEGYGKVLSRPGLHIVYRELCVVSMLSLKFRLRQLRSHIIGALRVGADVNQLETAIGVASNFLLKEQILKCENTLSVSVARHRMP